ncbi:MAG: hypothetical protein AAFX10_10855 [Pseudomonadota bacterium]
MPSGPDSNSVTGLLRNGGVRGYVGMTVNTGTRRGAWKAPTVVEHFMKALFRRSAFRGAGPKAAFCVPCRFRQTMTAVDIDAGRVIVQIGFAPFRPAEFVIFRIRDSEAYTRARPFGDGLPGLNDPCAELRYRVRLVDAKTAGRPKYSSVTLERGVAAGFELYD